MLHLVIITFSISRHCGSLQELDYNHKRISLQVWIFEVEDATVRLHCTHRGLDKNIASTTVPGRAVLSIMSLGVALRTDESGASEAAETFIFLASI